MIVNVNFQGLYPESHGIIDNWMYDKTFKDIFTLSGPAVTQGRWWNGEPVSGTKHQINVEQTYIV